MRHSVMATTADPGRGKDRAPVTIVVFSDFECPYCRQLEPALAKLLSNYSNQVRMVWKDFPSPKHQDARSAAAAAHCAGEQDSFWKYHDILFANQSELGAKALRSYGDQIGLNKASFEKCLTSNVYEALIARSVAEGAALGVSGTPTLFINGRAVIGAVQYEALEQVMVEELRRSARQGG